MIRQFLKWRNSPERHLAEVHELVVLAARRCAYDLLHAAGEIGESRYGTDYHGRANRWLEIFDPTDGPKRYRHELHDEIRRLRSRVKKYRQLLAANGIDDPFPEMPF